MFSDDMTTTASSVPGTTPEIFLTAPVLPPPVPSTPADMAASAVDDVQDPVSPNTGLGEKPFEDSPPVSPTATTADVTSETFSETIVTAKSLGVPTGSPTNASFSAGLQQSAIKNPGFQSQTKTGPVVYDVLGSGPTSPSGQVVDMSKTFHAISLLQSQKAVLQTAMPIDPAERAARITNVFAANFASLSQRLQALPSKNQKDPRIMSNI